MPDIQLLVSPSSPVVGKVIINSCHSVQAQSGVISDPVSTHFTHQQPGDIHFSLVELLHCCALIGRELQSVEIFPALNNLHHLHHLVCPDVSPPASCVPTLHLSQGDRRPASTMVKVVLLMDDVFRLPSTSTSMPSQEPQVQELIRTLTSLAGELEVEIFQRINIQILEREIFEGSGGQNKVR